RADPRLTIQMKSVGEAMAIGRTFVEALGKAIRSLEIGRDGLDDGRPLLGNNELIEKLRVPAWDRLFHLRRAFVMGMSVEEMAQHTRIDPWFLDAIRSVFEEERLLSERRVEELSREELARQAARPLRLRDRPGGLGAGGRRAPPAARAWGCARLQDH